MSQLKMLLVWHHLNRDLVFRNSRCACRRLNSSYTDVKNKRLYYKLKHAPYLQKGHKKNIDGSFVKTKKKQDLKSHSSSQSEVPLIVKLMSKTENNDSKNVQRSIEGNNVLLSELREIKHDFHARMLKAETMPEPESYVPDDQEIATDVSPGNIQNDYVETIFLDEDPSKSSKKTKQAKLLGTPVPGTGMSDVPCPGCGAMLHCEDPSLPGYLKGEKFTAMTTDELRDQVCQRCHLIKHLNLCLDVKVNAKDYANIISNIKDTNPLVIVMVDLLDIKNSLFPNLLETIGKNKKIIVVGNKIDLIPKDSTAYLRKVKSVLTDACIEAGLNEKNNIKHVALVSAKTGYGIEELINKLLFLWGKKGDIYLLGSTNTGKSTLFNTLLHSDLCKAHVRDLIHKATTSIWSGTTLNLLKFPIINPEHWRLEKRKERLIKQQSDAAEERKILKMSRIHEQKCYEDTILTANVTTTDFRSDNTKELEEESENEPFGDILVSFERTKSGEVVTHDQKPDDMDKPVKYSDLEKQFLSVKWLFDTPGVMKTEQIVNLLKAEEVKLITPKKRIIPRVYMLKPGEAMFITGLSRLDYIKGNHTIYITVFTDLNLPVITKTLENADNFYEKRVGTPTLKVPSENTDHLPSLIGRYFEIQGDGLKKSTADIQLSSLGWVSVAIKRNEVIGVRAYTPGGHGCLLRETSFLSDYKHFQGQRIPNTNRFEYKIPS